jgi:molybdate transport system substrate-binding protein
MMKYPVLLAMLAVGGVATGADAAQRAAPLVLAAASLQESMTAAADAWAAKGHVRPTISFAAGATADLFVSADEDWMNELAKRRLIVPASRVTFLGNRLVVAAASGTTVRIPSRPPAALVRVLTAGPLAMADTPVPAGRYGQEALEALGVWKQVAPRVVRAENVRATLALVERGAAPLGIVYATDAKASTRVRIAGVFPASTHPAITYPIARLSTSRNPEAEAFRRFLTSRQGKAIFVRYGFLAR